MAKIKSSGKRSSSSLMDVEEAPVKVKTESKKDAKKKGRVNRIASAVNAAMEKRAAKTAAAVKKSKKGSGSPLLHKTDRYHREGEPSTRGMVKRYALQEHIASGDATIGSVLDGFGEGRHGMRRVARYVRKGYYGIRGVSPVPDAKNDFAAEKALAAKLSKLGRHIKIQWHRSPVELLER